MKTYITEEQLQAISTVLTQLIKPDYVAKLKGLKKKYGIEFCHTRETNMQLFFKMAVTEIDNLPKNDPWKSSLTLRNLFWDGADHAKGVTLPLQATVSQYMSMKGYTEDYLYLCNLETRNLQDYIYNIVRDYELPEITVSEMLQVYPNFKDYYSQYTKKNCDKTALDYTRKISNLIDENELLLMQTIVPAYKHFTENNADATKEVLFDKLHQLIHNRR